MSATRALQRELDRVKSMLKQEKGKSTKLQQKIEGFQEENKSEENKEKKETKPVTPRSRGRPMKRGRQTSTQTPSPQRPRLNVDRYYLGPQASPNTSAQHLFRDEKMTPRTRKSVEAKTKPYMVLKLQLARLSRKEKQRIFSELNMDPELKKKKTLPKGSKKAIAKEIGMDRRSVFKDREIRRARKDESERKEKIIQAWMRDPTNSTMLPGRKDGSKKKKRDTEHIETQKVVLMDTLVNCHQKFLSQCHPADTVSLPTFCRARPADVKLFHVLKHQCCLCKAHSNVQYMCQAIKNLPNSTTNLLAMPDEEIKSIIDANPSGHVKYYQWEQPRKTEGEKEVPQPKKKNKVDKVEDDNDKKESKSGQRLYQKVETKEVFRDKFIKLLPSFREHCFRVENQNQAVKDLRERLPMHQAVIQVDYAENWSTDYGKEIQSAYYNKPQVTLKAMVAKVKDFKNLPLDPEDEEWMPEEGNDGQVYHYNYVGATDDHSHGFESTFTFIASVIERLQKKHPALQYVWFISDSPSSQYRNRYICSMLLDSNKLFKVRCAWTWLESGHGKGACDGVGGAVKRIASRETKKEVIIQSAQDFVSNVHSEKIELIHKSKEEIEANRKSGKCKKIRASTGVEGISKAHQAVVIDGVLHIRDLSCFKACCMRDDGRMIKGCQGWKPIPSLGYSYSDDEDEELPDNVPSTINEHELLQETPFPHEVLDPECSDEEEEEEERPRFYARRSAARATRKAVKKTIRKRKTAKK